MGAPGEERLSGAGEALLTSGQEIHPCTEGVSYCLEGEAGLVYGPEPGTGPAITGNALGSKCTDESLPYRRVRAVFKDKTRLISEPDGLTTVALKNVKSQPERYKFKLQGRDLDLSAAVAATRLRQTLVVGDTCMTASLLCVDKSGGKTKQCAPDGVGSP